MAKEKERQRDMHVPPLLSELPPEQSGAALLLWPPRVAVGCRGIADCGVVRCHRKLWREMKQMRNREGEGRETFRQARRRHTDRQNEAQQPNLAIFVPLFTLHN